jgi:PhzF family phenazine biosynthesis protein
MNTLPLYQVDAFTAQLYAGNPAGVCLLDKVRPDNWMQSVAMEMNLSETAFLLPENDGFRLRWFTPAAEVALCGHATLASAHTLWETGLLRPNQTARFYTLSGLLTAQRNGQWIELNFPAKLSEAVEPPPALLKALGIHSTVYIGKNLFDYLVEVETEAEVRSLSPDFALLKTVDVRGVMVTARSSTTGFDFVSRFFAPRVGVNEDPVTGSAHCCLTPYWSGKLGRTAFTAYQASARGGVLNLRLEGDRVVLAGQAVTFFKAELNVPE